MTDITELAQREKFEAWFKSSFHPDKTGPYIKDQLYFAWKAAGAELVEALEKAQQVDEELCKLLPPGAEYMDPPDGGDVTPLEGVRRMVADYRQRIAELESRTVKMPHRNLGHPKLFLLCPFPYYDAEDMEKALAAAGIRVEAE
ncbi:hypothetical protein RZP29_23030 [Klebsiella quasipneumoniae subsp. similipneumoniae]|jgi:hypothetical protein|uniref:Ead/Ea22-like family protein n=1 Tax=Klebsiella quasipneumoniae subsp. similipneumoniae TaxID=1463164 RepID=A0AAE4SI63_9ENTR|nr:MULTISPECIES: hypothetical protein [Klebsiella]HCB1359616.1 hypothetical protein [Klebsiella variicola subsp. variicola]HCM6613359.1 hypothetical protein [Klebsiella quasipneumoniae]HDT2742876.1 hypothetical protein [Klebsiella pneumoniae subsp. pneumoniae]EKU7648866.1 hypothetical protein [Klebsiella pneumoniae]MDV0613190.1 hypothetical protein [Klebsiella quasipneumoniae subsp. similipneumoniae]